MASEEPFEWSAEYNDYLVFYSEDGAGEDEEDEHSVWTWLKSATSQFIAG